MCVCLGRYQEDETCDIPMALLITGQVGAPMMLPAHACGLRDSKGDARDLGDVTASALLTDPRVATKRSQCMEYIQAQQRVFGAEAPELFIFNGKTCVKVTTHMSTRKSSSLLTLS